MASENAIDFAAMLLEEVSQADFCLLFFVTTIQMEKTSSRIKRKKRRYSKRNLKREPNFPAAKNYWIRSLIRP
jgi:hypothetical protein